MEPTGSLISHPVSSSLSNDVHSNGDSDIIQLSNTSNIITLAHLATMSASNANKVCQNLELRLDYLAAALFSNGTIL